ncbi:putative urea active transporter 1 [Kluyveromyces marxianus]
MNSNEINSGFGLPYTLMAVLGKGSLGALLLATYLAVTSTVSAQMIAVSSIISFDIYRKYFNSKAENSQLIKVSHIGVIFFGLFSAGFTVMLHYVGVDMTWMGQTKLAAMVSPILGCIAGIAVGLGTAFKFYGEVTIKTTGAQLPCMYGGLTALFLPAILTVIISLCDTSYRFDWAEFNKANLIVNDLQDEVSETAIYSQDKLEESRIEVSEAGDKHFDSERNLSVGKEAYSSDIVEITDSASENATASNDQRIINIYTKIAAGSVVFVLLITWLLWPLPLYRDYIFSKAFFTGWTVMSIFWVYLALIMIGFFPLWDGRHSLIKIVKGIQNDLNK